MRGDRPMRSGRVIVDGCVVLGSSLVKNAGSAPSSGTLCRWVNNALDHSPLTSIPFIFEVLFRRYELNQPLTDVRYGTVRDILAQPWQDD